MYMDLIVVNKKRVLVDALNMVGNIENQCHRFCIRKHCGERRPLLIASPLVVICHSLTRG